MSMLAVSGSSVFAADTISRLEHFLVDVQGLRARFKQAVLDDEKNVLQESTGELLLKRPGRFRWDYTAPFEQHIISDGSRIWMYDPELEQVTVKPLDITLASSPALLLSGDHKIDDKFELRNITSDDALEWVELIPIVKDTDFQRIRIGFDTDFVEVMELSDTLGQTTRITFLDVAYNVDVDDSEFEFTPPQGVDVIGESTDGS